MTPPALSAADLYAAWDTDASHIAQFLRWLASSYGLADRLRVLDGGCGIGRLFAPLAGLGWTVAGMEPHPDFADRAQGVAAALPGVTVRLGGFQDVDDDTAFDLAVAVNSAFAHLLTPAARGDAFRRLHRALRPGGVLFLDLPNFPWILRNYTPPRPMHAAVGGRRLTLTRAHEIDWHAHTFTTRDTYHLDGEEAGEMVHAYAMATLPEIEHALAAAGFADLRTYRGYASRAHERLDGPRMLIAARRPA